MNEKNYTGTIPKNAEGREITVEASIQLQNETDARAFYQAARQRLLAVNNWGNITGTLSADFQLTDSHGKKVDRPIQQHDHFRIDIAGPGSAAGEGYDWAFVEEVKEVNEGDVDSVAVRVRPAANPQTDNDNVAHFYAEKSTSTFIVTREGTLVTASVYDRNIEANQETSSIIDKARNTVVGLGAKHGLSRVQWQALADALLAKHK